MSRTTHRGSYGISVTISRNINIISHFINADISMLKDFDLFKENLTKIGKSLVTIGRPFEYDGFNVSMRDTILLSPVGGGGLYAIGKVYKMSKVDVSKYWKENMDIFREEEAKKFFEYGIQDSAIVLAHITYMEDFYHKKVGEPGLPLTIASLAQKYVESYWEKIGFSGYQISVDYLIGDAPGMITPKGLIGSGMIGIKLPLYISSYKGGRNESYKYGLESETV